MTLIFRHFDTIALINDPKKGHFFPPPFLKRSKRSFSPHKKGHCSGGGDAFFLKSSFRIKKFFSTFEIFALFL